MENSVSERWEIDSSNIDAERFNERPTTEARMMRRSNPVRSIKLFGDGTEANAKLPESCQYSKCGKPLTRKDGRDNTKRFCCTRCRRDAYNEQRNELRKKGVKQSRKRDNYIHTGPKRPDAIIHPIMNDFIYKKPSKFQEINMESDRTERPLLSR